MDCTAAAETLAAPDLVLIVVCSLLSIAAVLRVWSWLRTARSYSRPDRVLSAMERGDYSRALLRAASGTEPAAVPVLREGHAVQYRFPAHDRAECVNAQCADHYGPFPLGGGR